jgi:hypothetical protein
VVQKFGTLQGHACRERMQNRTTQRYVPKDDAEGKARGTAMLAIVAKQPRHGCVRVVAVLRRDGWRVIKKRVHRLWKRQGRPLEKCQR